MTNNYVIPYEGRQRNAQIFTQLGNFEDARREIEICIKKKPEDLSNYYGLGTIYYNLHEYDKAIFNLEKDSSNSDALFLIARIYYETGKFDEAIEYAKKAIKVNTKTAKPYRILGSVYFEKNEFEKAKDCYEEILKIDKKNPEAYYALASCYAELREYKKAIKYYKRAIEIWKKAKNRKITLRQAEQEINISFAYYWIGFYYIDRLNKERKGLKALVKSTNMGYKKAYQQIKEFGLVDRVTIEIINSKKLVLINRG